MDSRQGGPGDIPLAPVGLPRPDSYYRPFLLSSLALAVLFGFALGIHIPVSRLLGPGLPERALDLIQAHGQVQLLGFAGLFVMGMSLRLMPRFAGSEIRYPALAPTTLVLLILSLLMRALVLPLLDGSAHAALLVLCTMGVLLGASSFLFLTFATLTLDVRRFDPSSLAFVLGAAMLFAGALVSAIAAVLAVEDGGRALPYLADAAVIQLLLTGFILSFILGVALRAIPQMVGIERPGRSAGILAVLLAGIVALTAAAFLYIEYVEYATTAVLLADASFAILGVVLLALVWGAGVFRQAANRLRPASQSNLWLIRSAFAWMLMAAVLAVYAGCSSFFDGELLQQSALDAFRHALGIGVITMLISGMGLMILPEFAAERQRKNGQRRLALVLVCLLNSAAVLRVGAALAQSDLSFQERNIAIGSAGVLAELALLSFALYFLRLIRNTS